VQEAPADFQRLDAEALNLVGLTRRAGRAVIGTKAVREAARRGTLSLALVSRDAGDNALSRVVPRGCCAEATRRWVGRSVGIARW
jgi:ribosomal protein L7Ae-like RNA K-turn-binding protein